MKLTPRNIIIIAVLGVLLIYLLVPAVESAIAPHVVLLVPRETSNSLFPTAVTYYAADVHLLG